MRHDLHRLAEVVALALALDDVLVDLACGDVVVAREGDVEVALIVAQVEVDFAAVGEDEHLAVPRRRLVCQLGVCRVVRRVLFGIHSPSVDIEVGVHLDGRDVQPCQYQLVACHCA